MRNRFSRIFRGAGKLQGLGAVEGCGETDFADLVRIDLNVFKSVEEFRSGETHERRTPLRVAFAAAEVLALGFLPFDFDLSSMYLKISNQVK